MKQIKNRLRREIGNKVQRKITGSRGMSLGEILIAVLIMLLSTSVVVATVRLGLNQYISTLSRSEANVLSSTLQSLITNELAYTTEIHVKDSGDVEFQSQNYVTTDSLSTFTVDSNGKVKIGEYYLLGDGSYPNDLKVKDLVITYEKSIFTVSFTIYRNSTEIPVKFQVININDTEADPPDD